MKTNTFPLFFLSFVSLLWNVFVFGQTPLTFTKYKAEHGLSSEFITTIFQDTIGFLWLGTPGGLHRYDGYNFKVFRYDKTDSLTLSNDGVWNIEEDREGNIWIGTNNGLNRLNPKTEQITRIKSNPTSTDSITNSLIMDLLVDKAGNVWVATANGLNRWLPQYQCFEHYLHEPNPSEARPFRSSRTPIQTRNGIIWLGLQDTLCRYVADQNDFAYTRLPGKKAAANAIRLIYEDQEGLLWIGTQSNGIFSFDPTTSTFLEHYFNDPDDPNSISHNKISAFIQNGDELWIGTTGGGLNILNLKTKWITRYTGTPSDPFGINSETIRDAWEDNQGNIWLGSFYDGLYQYKNNQRIFSNFDQNTGLLSKVVNDIVETPDGKIWVAMGNAGVGVFDTRNKRFTKYYRNENNQQALPLGNLRRLRTDYTGQLWVASETEGISYFDEQLDRFKKHIPKRKEELPHFDFLTDFLVEKNGDIWIALQTGLVKYQAATQSYQTYTMPDKPNSKINYGNNYFVTSIYRDSQQQLWFTTYGGLNLYHPASDSLEFFPFPHQLLGSIEDNNNNLWFSALEGCYSFNTDQKAFSKINNLIGNPFLKDDKQQIWLSSTEYLSKYNPANGQITTLDKQDGLVSNFFWKAHQDKDGYLYFGGTEGLSIFHPDSLKEVNQSPPVVLTDFRLFNKTVPIKGAKGDTLDWKSPLTQSIVFTRNITLNHWQNYFSIEFAALDFTNPASNRYQYQLEGYDKNWIESSANRRLITYTNLDPGTYTFQVKGASRNGPWSEITSLNIQILPPWYWSWWSKFLYFFLLAATIYTFYRFQLRRRLAEAEANQIKALDEVKTRLYTNITHEFRTPLTVILGLADEIKTTSQQQLKAIKQNGRQLLQLVNQMLALSKLESGKEKLNLQQSEVIAFLKYLLESFHSYAELKHIELQLDCHVEELYMDYDAEKLQQVISNLISNAIKFTPAGGWVRLKINQDQDQLRLEIADNGAGIKAENLAFIFDRYYQVENIDNTGSDIGLTLVKEYVQLFDGDIEVQSELGEGTTFYLQLPIRQNAVRTETTPEIQSSTVVPTPLPDLSDVFSDEDRPQLLLVEDNKDVQQYLSLILSADYNLSYANDGQEGTQKALANVPDLIISDVMMPRKNGYELCDQLKKDERSSHIPIILLTAKADFDSKMEGLELGADVYLNKPFQKQELLIQVHRLLEQRKRLQAHYSQLAMLPTKSYQVAQAEESFLYRAQAVIEAHLDEPEFNTEALCKALHISKTHLYRKLKALTGKSIAEYIRSVRLNRGKDLLTSTDKSISEIAFDVGFSSSSYFSRSFAKEFGMSPKAFRADNTSL